MQSSNAFKRAQNGTNNTLLCPETEIYNNNF